jgi:hypothetical protein
MPKPKEFTQRQAVLRDRIAKKLEDNPDVKEPYAVATNIVKRKRSKAKEK